MKTLPDFLGMITPHFPPPRDLQILAEPILNVVVDDEVEFRVGETVMSRQHPVDLMDNCPEYLHFYGSFSNSSSKRTMYSMYNRASTEAIIIISCFF